MRFHTLKVIGIEPTAEDAVCVSLAVPPAERAAFEFRAGQYLTVRRALNGRIEQRTYSIVNAPGGALLRLGVRVQPHGRMSRELAQRLRPGDELEVGTPLGRFGTAAEPTRRRSYVAFAAGSGITPVLSLAAHLLEREPHSRFLLLYGNRSSARTMFLEETLALKNRYLERFSVLFIMSREPQDTALLNGRIDRTKVEALAAEMPEIARADEYFVCGPAGMIGAVQAALATLNPEAPVRIERFSAGGHPEETRAAGDAAAPNGAPNGAPAGTSGGTSGGVPGGVPVIEPPVEVGILMDGRRRHFTMSAQDGSVLAAAERAGLRLPFSCRSGICATCRAKVTAGEAVMAHNIALEPWEVEAGFVLCCQARPTTPVLELSYDEK